MYYLVCQKEFNYNIGVIYSGGEYEEQQKVLVKKINDQDEFKFIGFILRKGKSINEILRENDVIKTNKGVFLITSLSFDENKLSLNYEMFNFNEIHIKEIFINTKKNGLSNTEEYLKVWGNENVM